ncbi:MAG: O-antigen ligase family protein, partial [Prevotellaceae bacterium]|nr:O-antigen ligase family protein [Prevotellaceae bacterium]
MKIRFLTSATFFIAGLAVLCCITLFFSSRHFVNHEISPKWFGMIVGVAVAGIIFGLLQRKVYIPAKALLLFIVISYCFIFVRDWAVFGFNSYLLMQTVCFVLLLFVLQQTIPVLPTGYLFGMFTLLAIVLAIHGLLQYAGILYSTNRFRITGNFDNPAGYAAALVCVFPYVFYFFKNSRRAVGYIAAVIAFVVFITAILSGSRAAMIACAVVSVCFLFSGYLGLKIKKTLKILFVCVAIAGMTGLYFLKKDSADGRLLIWQTTWNMIKDKPLTGHGYGAFNAQYMLYQA